MLDKFLRLAKKVPPIILTYMSVIETIKLTFFSMIIMLFMLCITHLLITGEFGFCYWSYNNGWHWFLRFNGV